MARLYAYMLKGGLRRTREYHVSLACHRAATAMATPTGATSSPYKGRSQQWQHQETNTLGDA
jgi:hypothetical protein